jgi:hypothetical protein
MTGGAVQDTIAERPCPRGECCAAMLCEPRGLAAGEEATGTVPEVPEPMGPRALETPRAVPQAGSGPDPVPRM